MSASGGRVSHPGRAIALALASTLLYGNMSAGTGFAFKHGISPFDATFLRTLIVTIGMLAIIGVQRAPIRLPKDHRLAFWMQCFATLVISVGFLGAVAFIPVSLTIILFYTFPIFTLLASPFLEGKKLGALELMAVLVAFIGLGIAVGPSLDVLDWRGVALALSASLAVVVQFNCAHYLGASLPPATQGFLVHLVILPATLAIALFADGGNLTLFTAGSAVGVGALLLVGTLYFIAFFLHMWALSLAPASMLVPFYNLEPIVSIIMAAVLVQEILSPLQYGGVALVMVGLFLASMSERRK